VKKFQNACSVDNRLERAWLFEQRLKKQFQNTPRRPSLNQGIKEEKAELGGT